MSMTFAQASPAALPIILVSPEACAHLLDDLPEAQAQWAAFHGFKGSVGQTLILPGSGLADDGAAAQGAAGVLIGTGTAADRARNRFAIGAAIAALPEATYAIGALPDGQGPDGQGPDGQLDEIALGYLLSLYRFDRYREQPVATARLVAPQGVDAQRLQRIAAAEALTRDLINTPAEDMGPDALEAAVRDLAGAFAATVATVEGPALLEQNFPLIHTVGRAAAKAPRLIEMTWNGSGGASGPALTLVGKGVCFDTGGLNLKPGASMGIMKKDMGGAANVLGLARMIMASGMDVRLRVLIPAVENNIAGNSFRPGDILTARNGLTVEVNNTDAEGRLVLADALALASETPPDLLICMATLTGAARVAVGPDIAPFFTDDEALSRALTAAGNAVADPVWRLPFHDPYELQIEPGIADLDNAPAGGMAGAITAALFLRRFAPVPRFVHFDIYGWQRSSAPARPKGGVGQGIRALFDALPEVLSK